VEVKKAQIKRKKIYAPQAPNKKNWSNALPATGGETGSLFTSLSSTAGGEKEPKESSARDAKGCRQEKEQRSRSSAPTWRPPSFSNAGQGVSKFNSRRKGKEKDCGGEGIGYLARRHFSSRRGICGGRPRKRRREVTFTFEKNVGGAGASEPREFLEQIMEKKTALEKKTEKNNLRTRSSGAVGGI